jgi:hypothetical protein
MKNGTWINCGNDFYQDKFVIVCERLEEGLLVDVYIDCIGHTRNNMTQEHYKKKLIEKYGDRLEVIYHDGVCSYSYSYKLK